MAYVNISLFEGENIVSPPQGDPLGLLGSVLQFQNMAITTESEKIQVTTLALGEEDISLSPPLMPYPSTKAVGEEESIPIYFQPTTLAIGEEESSLPTLLKTKGNRDTNYLIGNSEADHIDGMGGNDYIFGNRGNDFLFGGSGVDEVLGGDDDDVLGGGDGKDLIDGGSGEDTADFSDKRNSVVVNLKENQVFSFVNKVQEDRLISIENLIGGSGSDIFSGGDEDNIFAGGAGNDTLAGWGGNNVLIGGIGNDVYILDSSGKTIIVENKNQGIDTIKSSVDVNLVSFVNIENIFLEGGAKQGIGNDIGNYIEGNASDNFIDGGAGNDILIGGLGNDLFFDGKGLDTIDGGEGIDSVDYSDRSESIRVTLRGSSRSSVSFDRKDEDSVKNIESFISGKGNDTLIGDQNNNLLMSGAGDDLIKGGQGDDILNGGDGLDTVDYSEKKISVHVILNQNEFSSALIGPESDLIINFENVIGGMADDRIIGDKSSNQLNGGMGADTLIGGLGADVLTGGQGKDRFVFNNLDAIDQITDFRRGQDQIYLDPSVFLSLNGILQTSNFRLLNTAQIDTKNYDSDDFILFNNQTKMLMYDADGNGMQHMPINLALLNVNILGVSDLIVTSVSF
jgi:Ca2+-binding RTX toxin-like protein